MHNCEVYHCWLNFWGKCTIIPRNNRRGSVNLRIWLPYYFEVVFRNTLNLTKLNAMPCKNFQLSPTILCLLYQNVSFMSFNSSAIWWPVRMYSWRDQFGATCADRHTLSQCYTCRYHKKQQPLICYKFMCWKLNQLMLGTEKLFLHCKWQVLWYRKVFS